LENIEAASIDHLTIIGNDQLATCDVQSICDYLAAPNGTVTIFGNATGCNNPGEIALSCGYPIPCLPFGDYYFSTQTDIDNFQTNFPGCTELEGNVKIWGEDIISLEGLSVITSILGDLELRNNPALISLNGLEGLTDIVGSITLSGNDALVNLEGMEGVTSIGDFMISDNESLVNLIGVEGLTSIGGGFYINGNESLTSTTGLGNLATIGGTLSIGCGWGVLSNPNLASLAGLENLNSIGDGLCIEGNTELNSLIALGNLTSVGGEYNEEIRIIENESLTSLAGLDNIVPESIEAIIIEDNAQLSECHIQSICDYLAAPNSYIGIENNAPGCNSPEEVQEACDSTQTVVSKFNHESTFTISPNPCSGTIKIRFEVGTTQTVNCDLINISGVRIKELISDVKSSGIHEMEIDLSDLKPGVYFCTLRTSDGIQTKKAIKVD